MCFMVKVSGEDDMLDWKATRTDIEKAAIETVILPIGSIEQHGPHLPIGCDHIQAETLARRIAEKIGNALLLPALPYSNATEHMGFAGTVCMRPATLMQVIEDLTASIRQWGSVKHLVLMNLHGGNWALKPAVRELNRQYRDLLVILIDPMRFYPASDSELHAGKAETSVMIYLLGEQNIHKASGRDYVPESPDADDLNYTGMREITPDGIWGKPSEASIEFGKRVVDEFVNGAVEYIVKTIRNVRRLRNKK
jgi:creatinine amidohydrolase/Fe(II)-dependent formamide hydrolase-like protein